MTSIGDWAFENCKNLKTIRYTGTMAQWEAISKASDWNYATGKYVICCTDGDINK